MAAVNPVIWSEGLFIRPHHFQHQQRYMEDLVSTATRGIDSYQFGFTDLMLDTAALGEGKIKVLSAAGTMPDGTAFAMPAGDPVPPILSLDTGMVDGEIVYLCLLARSPSAPEYSLPGNAPNPDIRYAASPLEIRDATLNDGFDEEIHTAKVQMKLCIGSEDLSSYETLAAFQIQGRNAEGRLTLNPLVPLAGFTSFLYAYSCRRYVKTSFLSPFHDRFRFP